MIFIDNMANQVDPERLSLRLLAGLGDTVSSLMVKEQALLNTHSANQMHNWTKARINARAQAAHLNYLMQFLNEKELNLVKRASNLKLTNYDKAGQTIARQANAYEILLGYLYLADLRRLKELIKLLDLNSQNIK